MRLEEGIALVKTKLQNFRMEDGTLVYHTLSYLKEVGQGPFWKQYLLNPTVSYDDAIYVIVAFIGLMFIRVVIGGCSSGPLKKLPCISKNLAKSNNWTRPGKLHKFGENVWYTLWHGTACLWGLYVLYWEAGTPEVPGWPRLHMGQPDGRWYWMASPEELSRGSGGWPLLVPSVPARNYYLCQLAFWITCLVFMNLETRRRDFGLFLLHHVLTITLVGLSYCCSYWKLGTVLHIYWFYCIIRMIIGLVRAIRKGSREDCEDIRSEDGSDDETNEDAKKIQLPGKGSASAPYCARRSVAKGYSTGALKMPPSIGNGGTRKKICLLGRD
ncbi:uncharacterized protein LOC34621671 [Cyclospora cayetanensis]|uniref:Uncharacterized protein LOC34621671 n=1 Tax=Cyclospora cayetanensis TaxID=88456 RepID=A0A6P6S0U6_9EIME|nr:uncharacterized protein LOC34621671 [Cyclospora cayetanensis]